MKSTDYLTHIADVLTIEDMVVIPGFGGFITKYRSASINAASGHIEPPTKYIAFNQQLDQSDNTFARYLDEQTFIEFSPRSYDQFVSELKTTLAHNDIIQIPRVGRLYQDYEGVVHFLPEEENLNNDTFGLPSFTYVPRKRINPALHAEKTIEQNSPMPLFFRVATAASVIFLIGLLSWIGIKSSNINGISTSNKISKVDSSSNTRTSELSIIDVLKDTPLVAETENDLKTSPVVIPESKVEDKKTLVFSNVIIVGAFSKIDNVERMEKRIKSLGYETFRDQVRGLSRVGIQVNYGNQKELEDILDLARNEITSKAWLLK